VTIILFAVLINLLVLKLTQCSEAVREQIYPFAFDKHAWSKVVVELYKSCWDGAMSDFQN